MSEKQQKAFDFAQEVSNQLITLATGIIAITITFLSDILKEKAVSDCDKQYLVLGWIILSISVAFGVLTLMALTGTLAKKDNPSIYERSVVINSIIQIITFFLGLGLIIYFASKTF